jgi:hypothetical protein
MFAIKLDEEWTDELSDGMVIISGYSNNVMQIKELEGNR